MGMKHRKWAEEDGVRIGERGDFYPECYCCGEEMRTTLYQRHHTYICPKCRKIIFELRQERINGVDKREKSEKRFDKAVEKLRKQKCGSEWDKAIEIARTKVDKYGSIPEAMMAIALIHYRYKIIPQQKIGQYTVDFAIPKEQIVVEVDGKLYHSSYSKEVDRDSRIILMLGNGWDVMHVPAEEIEKDIRNAIDFYVKRQKRTVIR